VPGRICSSSMSVDGFASITASQRLSRIEHRAPVYISELLPNKGRIHYVAYDAAWIGDDNR
jgi:hypothetical protein